VGVVVSKVGEHSDRAELLQVVQGLIHNGQRKSGCGEVGPAPGRWRLGSANLQTLSRPQSSRQRLKCHWGRPARIAAAIGSQCGCQLVKPNFVFSEAGLNALTSGEI
jgi:hypothetical protein